MRTVIAFITVVSWLVAVPTVLGATWFGIRLLFAREIEILLVAQSLAVCIYFGILPWIWLIVRYSA